MRTLYTLLLRLLLPFVLVRLWLRGRREPGYREGVSERFGVYRGEKPEKLVWVHAVSVGEARAAAPLVRALAARMPDHSILVTCTTAAGRETLRQVYGDSVLAAFLPYDFPEAVQAFLAHFSPRLGVLMETEVWPNLLAACAARGVPVVLANARLSEKSARGYLRLRSLAAPAFGSLALACAQSDADATRLRSVGARRVEVTGNLKFDVGPDAEQLAAGRAWRAALGRPVLLLASTREGEEATLLKEIGVEKNLLVLVVPRHPQRFDEVAPLAQSRRSRDPVPAPEHRVHLGDTMGEMPFYYAACDVAVIGGSFAPLGGQNLIEALAAGAPVVLGPSMFNFAEATRLAVEAGAALQAADAASAVRQALELVRDARRRRRMADAGRRLCLAHRGATERHLALIAQATAPARG
ncbi:MAG TPA: 3-deoxy-D-manno-octulosonic acid transferase [Burkholderiales bacterium]|nr:3-deoxy-D-manno-octulosonic acid transferase [Burkholderiales bacterium]